MEMVNGALRFMKNTFRMTIMTAVLIMGCSSAPDAAPRKDLAAKPMLNFDDSAPLRIWVEEKENYVKYVGSKSSCKIIWRLAKDHSDLSLQSICRASLKKQFPIIFTVLAKLEESEKYSLRENSYKVSLCCFKEMSRRIPLAAYHSPEWDKRRGVAKNLDPNKTLVQLMNEKGLYPEFKYLFEKFGFTLKVVKTAKMSYQPASTVAYFDWLSERGVDKGSILPVDPVVFWQITKAKPLSRLPATYTE